MIKLETFIKHARCVPKLIASESLPLFKEKNLFEILSAQTRIFNGLRDFSCGRVTGRGPRSLCLTAAEPAMEICFGTSVVGFAGSGCSGCFVVGEVSQSIGF